MFRKTIIVTATALTVFLARPAHADLRVVATVPDLASLAREVGGNHVHVTALALPTQDPHFVDAKPSLVLEVNKADILIAVGLSLEIGWLPTLQRGARNRKIQNGGSGYVDCSQFVSVRDIKTGKVDRTMGDVHPDGNPHYLYDPRAARACAAGIAQRMIRLDPGNAGNYKKNLAAFTGRLDAQVARWEKKMAPYKGTSVVTYHESWGYLIAWLGFRKVATLEPKPGIAPSPKHIMEVIRAARQARVKLLLQETFYPARTAKLVAGKIGAREVEVESGSDFRHGQGYLEHLDQVINSLDEALD